MLYFVKRIIVNQNSINLNVTVQIRRGLGIESFRDNLTILLSYETQLSQKGFFSYYILMKRAWRDGTVGLVFVNLTKTHDMR